MPDRRHFVYVRRASDPTKSGIYIGSVDWSPDQQGTHRLALPVGKLAVAYMARPPGSPSTRRREPALTSFDERVNMMPVVRLRPLGYRVVSGALALALALVSVATCFAGTLQLMEQSHRASCHGMQAEESAQPSVGTPSQAPDCCAVQHAILGLGGAADALSPPSSTALIVSPAPLAGFSAEDSRAPISSSPPTYLLFSVFRI